METPKGRDNNPNRRSARRRVLRQPATLTLLPGNVSRSVTLWDLGLDGLSVLSPRPVPPGSRCELQFDLTAGGQSQQVNAAGKTVYSSYVGAEGFRIGLVFTRLPDDAAVLIERFAADAP
jgi:hypothetical protein